MPSANAAEAAVVDDLSQEEFDTWRANFAKQPTLVNARLLQTVPAQAGQTYHFQGTSMFEDVYSGFVTTLDPECPFGALPSPTVTQFRMEFLDVGGNAIGTPSSLDLRTEQPFPGFFIVHTPLTARAPPGTQNVRVVAEALNMVWNGNTATMGNFQSAFFNDFILTAEGAPGTNLLINGDLNQMPAGAAVPEPRCLIQALIAVFCLWLFRTLRSGPAQLLVAATFGRRKRYYSMI